MTETNETKRFFLLLLFVFLCCRCPPTKEEDREIKVFLPRALAKARRRQPGKEEKSDKAATDEKATRKTDLVSSVHFLTTQAAVPALASESVCVGMEKGRKAHLEDTAGFGGAKQPTSWWSSRSRPTWCKKRYPGRRCGLQNRVRRDENDEEEEK